MNISPIQPSSIQPIGPIDIGGPERASGGGEFHNVFLIAEARLYFRQHFGGAALCQGIVHCGSCGRSMSTNYQPNGRRFYDCAKSRGDHSQTRACVGGHGMLPVGGQKAAR